MAPFRFRDDLPWNNLYKHSREELEQSLLFSPKEGKPVRDMGEFDSEFNKMYVIPASKVIIRKKCNSINECVESAYEDQNHLAFIEYMSSHYKHMSFQYKTPQAEQFCKLVEKFKKEGRIDEDIHDLCKYNMPNDTWWYDFENDEMQPISKSAIKKWEKTAPNKRIYILQMGIIWKLGYKEVNKLLRACGFQALNPLVIVDIVWIYYLSQIRMYDDYLEVYRLIKDGIIKYKSCLDDSIESTGIIDEDKGDVWEIIEKYPSFGLDCVINRMISKCKDDMCFRYEDILNKKNKEYLENGDEYKENLRYPDHYVYKEPFCNCVLDNKELNCLYREEILKEGKNSNYRQINTIMTVNTVISNSEAYIIGDEDDLKNEEINRPFRGMARSLAEIISGTRRKRRRQRSEGYRSISKLEYIKYVIACKKDTEIGEYLHYYSSFWKENYIDNTDELDQDEMDFTDYLLVYASKYREMLFADRKFKEKSGIIDISGISFIKILMTIIRDFQMRIAVDIKSNDSSIRKKAKEMLAIVAEFSPYSINLPRKLRSSKEKDNKEVKKEKRALDCDYECCPWLGIFETELSKYYKNPSKYLRDKD